MKEKTKICIFSIILLGIVIMLTTIVTAIVDPKNTISDMDNTGYTNIGRTYYYNLQTLVNSKNAYCTQQGKSLNSQDNYPYTLKRYMQIDGKEATVYSSNDGESKYTINADENAEIAYILNQKQGYGTETWDDDGKATLTHSEGQMALWHAFNSWVTVLGLDSYYYDGNDKIKEQDINREAEAYANKVGNSKTSSVTSAATTVNVTGATNKNNLTIVDVGGYYRIGPFKWNFDGTIDNIIAKGDKGDIADSYVRFVKYSGTTASVVKKSDIKSGEDFYVDVNQKANLKTFNGLTIKTKVYTETTDMKIYRSNIWIFENDSHQNILYTQSDYQTVKPAEGEGTETYDNLPLTRDIGLNKVDDRDDTKKLEKIGFKFKATVYRDSKWVVRYLGEDLKWSKNDLDSAKEFFVDENGAINLTITGETVVKNSTIAVETTNKNYGYEKNIGKEYVVGATPGKFLNHQYKVKLSGYVWIDTQDGKTTTRDDIYSQSVDNNGNGFNGIPVYLKDSTGKTVMSTTTSELGLYSEINGGEYQFVDVDLDKLQKGEYYVEFEYCGIKYQAVAEKLTQSNGSKSRETSSRDELDKKFTSVDGNGTDSLNINSVKVNYNGVNTEHKNSIKDCSGCDVYANTKEAGYNIYSDFIPTSEEIRNINLGLYEKAQTDYRISQDLYNVRVEVNGFSHIYRYGTEAAEAKNQSAEWNVGVQFQNNRGTYNRPIYTSDAEYEAPNHKDNELKVYLTYQIRMINESTYLGRINNIIDYSDSGLNMIAAGTNVNDQDTISGDLKFGTKTTYNDKYSSNVIEVNSTIKQGTENVIYVQYELNRESVLKIINKGDLINSTVEINSYTTFKNNNESTTVAVVDQDSVPGNAVPGNINTYEDDTFGARSLRLQLKNARSIEGTVFVDASTLNKNNERLGNGIFDNGETTVAGVKVSLNEIGKDDSSYDGERVSKETTTDANGNFTFTGYIPGNYNITYTWGDKTYKVQYYKGTIYDESRDQSNKEWYKVDVDTRKTDALDNENTRRIIDTEMRQITKNNLEDEINKAYNGGSDTIKTTTMNSTTPGMKFSVEYDTTITDGNDDKVEFKIKNIDFGIVERPKQKMEISKRVSAFKITLANGQVLVDATVDEKGKLHGSHDNLTYMGPTSMNEINVNGILRAEIDSELIEGATLEATYAIKVTNTSETDYDSERYYHYGNKEGATPVKSSATGVIDYLDRRLVSKNNDGWEEKDQTYLNDVNASEKDNTEYVNTTITYFTSQLSKPLAPGDSNEVTFNVSKLLASSDDNTFDNKTEIVDVTKNDGFNTGTPVEVTWNDGNFFFNTDNSEEIVVIPSTGENRNYTLPTIVGIVAITILGVGVFLIKKFAINKK